MWQNAYQLIVPVSFLLGLAGGYVMHRSDFCIAGMFRDLFLFRNTFMLKMLALLVVVSMVGFEAARLAGLIAHHPFPLLGPPSLVNLLGGMLFGLGMVLAGGCVVGTLYKMGAGSMLALTAFVGLVIGSTLYAEFHPLWAALGKAGAVFPDGVTLPEMLSLRPQFLVFAAAAGAAVLFYYWFRRGGWRRESPVEGFIQPRNAALMLALIGLTSYILVGMPLGITTAYAKMGAFVEQWFFPQRVAALAYFQAEGLNYLPPFAESRVQGGAGPSLDAIAAVQFPLIIGIVLGGALSAVLVREFRIYLRLPWKQYASAFAGGLVMGLAARMAPACNVWHLLGGLPILAVQSLLFLIGLFPGAWLGSRLLARLVLR